MGNEIYNNCSAQEKQCTFWWLKNYFISDLLCVIMQVIISITVSLFNYKNYNKYPIKQNSPLLTISCLISLSMITILTYIARIIVDEKNFNEDGPKISQCFLNYFSIRIFSSLYLFFEQYIVVIYCLKMLRVLTAYYTCLYQCNLLKNIMKSQLKTCILGCVYSLIIVTIDCILRINQDYQNQGSKQVNIFFCLPFGGQNLLFIIRNAFNTFVFFLLYSMAIKIPKKLNFKQQWVTALIIILTAQTSEAILQLYNISIIHCEYYTILISNLCQTLTIQRYLSQIYDVPTIPHDIDHLKQKKYKVSFQIPQQKISLKKYFQNHQSQYLFQPFCQIILKQNSFDTIKNIAQNLQKQSGKFSHNLINNILNNDNLQQSIQKLKRQIQQKGQQLYYKWNNTKAKQKFKQIYKKNSQYIVRLQQLNLSIG